MSKKLLSLLIVLAIVLFVITLPEQETDTNKESVQKLDTVKTSTTVKEDPLPNVHRTDWNLILVNADHPIETDKVNLVPLNDGHEIEGRVLPEFERLTKAAVESGISLVVISAYRSVAYQDEVFETDYQKRIYQGMSPEEAKEDTSKYILTPGTSEHHTGLALDVVDQLWYNKTQQLEEEFGETEAGKWLDENVSDYGFIIRYPRGKETITKINYEPWHLRYVGKENAQYINEHNITLEEYIELLEKAGK